ncbi:putative 26S proteasome regulatory subunit [Steccherinum ochraceum]|uniref:Probable 26S proteasome regulatory subunit p27 n=1 Tax=Steccherinum ochraceum TaxID=92696 RepID=A0A4R0S2Z2_9APHY|nr:putative 26S proteasome regulatory subunit [Steccherinum ochraceum]
MGFMLAARRRPTNVMQALSARKTAIEAEIEAQHEILKANNANFSTPLVDAEGFPRADLDVWAVRTARVRIIELRNDYKAILDDISKELQTVYARQDEEGRAEETQSEAQSESTEDPFAKVDGVAPGSPASVAGLQREDLIVAFGHLTKSSFSASSLQPLATLVSTREDREINIKILRSNELKSLVLIPKKGPTGRVTLGCHIVPYAA